MTQTLRKKKLKLCGLSTYTEIFVFFRIECRWKIPLIIWCGWYIFYVEGAHRLKTIDSMSNFQCMSFYVETLYINLIISLVEWSTKFIFIFLRWMYTSGHCRFLTNTDLQGYIDCLLIRIKDLIGFNISVLTLKRKYKKLTLNEIWGQFDPKTWLNLTKLV